MTTTPAPAAAHAKIIATIATTPPREVEITLALIERVETRMERSLPELLETWRALIPESENTDDETAAIQSLARAFGRYRMGEVVRFVAACLDVQPDAVESSIAGTNVFLVFWSLYVGAQRAMARLLGVELMDKDGKPTAPKAPPPSSSEPGPGSSLGSAPASSAS